MHNRHRIGRRAENRRRSILLSRHSRTLVLCSGLFSVLSGCSHLDEAGRQRLIEARDLFERDQTSAAVARLDRLIDEFERAVEIGEVHYLRGLCRIKKGELQAASEDFQRAAEKTHRDDLKTRCKVSLAGIAYRQGRWSEAADGYADALDDLPDSPPTDEILYNAGVAMQRAGRFKDGALQFARILSQFSHRPIAADARRLAGWQHEYFAIQLGAFQSASNARQAADSFRQRGLAFVQTEHHPQAGQPLWVVMAGQHLDYADAVQALSRVRGIQSDACIIPHP